MFVLIICWNFEVNENSCVLICALDAVKCPSERFVANGTTFGAVIIVLDEYDVAGRLSGGIIRWACAPNQDGIGFYAARFCELHSRSWRLSDCCKR